MSHLPIAIPSHGNRLRVQRSNGNGVFDPSSEPIGVYGGTTPVALNLARGRDVANASFTSYDPVPIAAGEGIARPIAPQSPLLQRVVDMLDARSEP